MSRRCALVALPLTVLVLALTACTEPPRIPPPEPNAATAPLFATDEEALAAATQAYEEFLRVSGEILRDGGADPERLRPLVSDEVYATEAEGFATLTEQSWVATGGSELVGLSLQQHFSGESGLAEVVAYACVSVAETDVLNVEGVSQVDPGRPLTIEFEVVFASTTTGALVLDQKTVWDNDSTCSLD